MDSEELSEQQVDTVIDAVKSRYELRIVALLTGIGAQLKSQGWKVADEPYELTDSGYSWWITTYRPGREEVEDNCVDLRLEIAESRLYDGDMQTGINFGLEAVEWGGRPLGGITPYNFTDEVWVDARDAAAVEKRFRIVDQVDVEHLIHLMS